MNPAAYPETLKDLFDCVAEVLTAVDPAAPLDVRAAAVIEGIRARFSGSLLYIPQGAKAERAARDAAIRQEFTGHNHRELARRYRLTVSKIYDVVARPLAE